ncbi:MAG TPA: DUF1003 domain-containing protein [Blastocatellia bacterium]|nr:DUF1003 domain-containing protein [Blastocatellia bacterium]
MTVLRIETAKKFLAKEIERLTAEEREVVNRFINRRQVARNVELELERGRTIGERIADRFAMTMGSWRFIILQSIILMIWVVLNLTAYINHWDPYPFILLNLALSFQAAYAAPIIMMSQNRQAEKDRLQSKNDYEVNLRAEMEIMQLHEKFNELRDQYSAELIKMQQKQLEMLDRIVGELATLQPRL